MDNIDMEKLTSTNVTPMSPVSSILPISNDSTVNTENTEKKINELKTQINKTYLSVTLIMSKNYRYKCTSSVLKNLSDALALVHIYLYDKNDDMDDYYDRLRVSYGTLNKAYADVVDDLDTKYKISEKDKTKYSGKLRDMQTKVASFLKDYISSMTIEDISSIGKILNFAQITLDDEKLKIMCKHQYTSLKHMSKKILDKYSFVLTNN